MFTLSKTIARTALAAAMLAGGGAVAQAGGGRVAVPEIAVPVPGGGYIDGCYKLGQRIYGPYRLSFCLDNGGGSYRVRGGGLDCRGGLSAYETGYGVEINLGYSQCGRGMAWTADNLSCYVANPRGPVYFGFGFGGGDSRVAVPEVAVPDVAVPAPGYGGGSLHCTYNPAAPGYYPIQVTAHPV